MTIINLIHITNIIIRKYFCFKNYLLIKLYLINFYYNYFNKKFQ